VAEIELHEDPRGIEIVKYNFWFQLYTAFERCLFDRAVMRRAAGETRRTEGRRAVEESNLAVEDGADGIAYGCNQGNDCTCNDGTGGKG